MAVRKPYQPFGAGQGMEHSAVGGPGAESGGMPMPPQLGRTGARPPMAMGGNGQPQPTPTPIVPPAQPGAPMQPNAGGPTSPMNISQMLQPNSPPPPPMPLQPWGEGASAGMGAGTGMGMGADHGAYGQQPGAGAGPGAGADPNAAHMGGDIAGAGAGGSTPMIMLKLMQMLGHL